MNTEKKNLLYSKLILFFSTISLILGFFLNEDSSGSGGFIEDFKYTWGYIEAIKYKFFVLGTQWTVHTPLHYILISKINIFITSEYYLRFFYCLISLLIPLLFYNCLSIKFPSLNRSTKLVLSSIIIILPAFRSSAIWLNAHNTALIFFLLFLRFFLIWEKNQSNTINKNIIYQTIFLALAVYTRQYYALIYLFLMYIFFKNLKLSEFIKISLFISLMTIPGFIHIYLDPRILSGTFDTNFSNVILVNSSIIGFYLLPVYLIMLVFNSKSLQIKNILKKKFTILGSLILLIICSFFFDYNYTNGGGFFIKLSYLIFKNEYLFFISSFVGFILLFELIKFNRENLILILILIFGFSAYIIYQKYYEPMFLLLLFLVLKNNYILNFLDYFKNIIFLFLYYLLYFFSAFLNNLFKITKYIN